MPKHSCIFCQIIAGELPSTVVHRDHYCLVILDIHPMSRGHLLIIPLEHHQYIDQVPAIIRDHLFSITSYFSNQIVQSPLRAKACNILINNGSVANQEIPHMHIHVIPRYTGDSLKMLAKMVGKPLVMLRPASQASLKQIASLIVNTPLYMAKNT